MRLLVVTHTFPPSLYTTAKRPFYVVKGCLEAGWRVDVVTSQIGVQSGAVETLTHPALSVRRCEDPADRFCQLFTRIYPAYRAVSLAVHGLLWPDEFVFWSLQALRFAHRHAAEYDAVLLFVLPASLLLAGCSSRLAGPRWVFDMQESVTPFYRQLPRRSPLQRGLLPTLGKLERRTLHRAGRVIFTAEVNRQTYLREGLVAPDITAHIPYFFDADAFQMPTRPAANRFQIGYFGTFDWRGARTPETFLRALARFLEQRPEARARTRFLFHGLWMPEHNDFIAELKLQDVVSLQVAVPYEKYLRLLEESSVLLLVVSALHSLFMPSKIVDYLGVGRPILAFAPRDSEMRQVLETAGMGAFASDERDVAGGAAALEQLWDHHQAGISACDAAKTRFWSSETQVPRYLELVTQVAGAARKRLT
jgi:glycosyltransferase involved in cell wall biosynthesis